MGFTGSNFDETFYLDGLHLHWGYNDYQGSEHTFDGNKYPLEVRYLSCDIMNAINSLN